MLVDEVYIADVFDIYKISNFTLKVQYNKSAIVLHQRISGDSVYVDLKTNEIYKHPSVTCNVGDCCVDPNSLMSVKDYVGWDKTFMTKKALIKRMSPTVERRTKIKK